MEKDLKVIKKKYGESMMHLCRTYFPTLLEQEGLLPLLLHNNFKESRSLAKDIIDNSLEEEFKNFIYNLVVVENNNVEKIDKTPEELLKEVGYKLYQCHTEEEIQAFKRYYSPGEELCTFRGGRLNRCHVFFAVKENVDEIRRENFSTPRRQDEYGTSVISIQFTKDNTHTLSIKNRYNHTVINPDATFGNDLDNIISGLTDSFDKYYGMNQTNLHKTLEIPGYVRARDGKLYKYNYEINNIYYCENNVIIDNFKVHEFPHEQYIVFDYFVLNLKNKQIIMYDNSINDSFVNSFGTIKKIDIATENEEKVLTISTDSNLEDIKITLDKQNRIVGLFNSSITNIGDYFLHRNEVLTDVELPKVTSIGDHFLHYNKDLTDISLPKVTSIGNQFLCFNQSLLNIELPCVTDIGDGFLFHNKVLTNISLPKVTNIGEQVLNSNQLLTHVELPCVTDIGDYFLRCNNILTYIELPCVTKIGNHFLRLNKSLGHIELPNAIDIGDHFLYFNEVLTDISLPKVTSIGDNFLYNNEVLTHIELPNAMSIGNGFCPNCRSIQTVNIPLLPEIEGTLKEQNGKHI